MRAKQIARKIGAQKGAKSGTIVVFLLSSILSVLFFRLNSFERSHEDPKVGDSNPDSPSKT